MIDEATGSQFEIAVLYVDRWAARIDDASSSSLGEFTTTALVTAECASSVTSTLTDPATPSCSAIGDSSATAVSKMRGSTFGTAHGALLGAPADPPPQAEQTNTQTTTKPLRTIARGRMIHQS